MCIHMIGYLHVRYATAGSTLCYHRGFCTPATQHHTKRYDMPVYRAARACCCCCLAAAARQGPQPTNLSGHASVNCIATARAAVAVQGEIHTYATASSAAPQQLSQTAAVHSKCGPISNSNTSKTQVWTYRTVTISFSTSASWRTHTKKYVSATRCGYNAASAIHLRLHVITWKRRQQPTDCIMTRIRFFS